MLWAYEVTFPCSDTWNELKRQHLGGQDEIVRSVRIVRSFMQIRSVAGGFGRRSDGPRTIIGRIVRVVMSQELQRPWHGRTVRTIQAAGYPSPKSIRCQAGPDRTRRRSFRGGGEQGGEGQSGLVAYVAVSAS